VDGTPRSYLLHLPPNPRGKPLIIALHPLGSNPMLMEAMTGLSSLADDEGFIVAYPEGTKLSEDGIRSWNARFCCRDAWNANVDDIGFLTKLIDNLTERHHVRGVLVTGFSNGGMLAHLAGIELSDRITAIAPVAATIGREILEMRPKRPLPVLMIHGTDDRLLPLTGTEGGRLLPVARAIDYWVGMNDCDRTPVIEERGGIEMSRYTCGFGSADVVVHRVRGAGHVWPGSRVRMRSEHDPRTLDASKVIVEFFLSRLR
ncbi:MAG: hypothetical protein ISF22_10455, partial [Methanomassiliicoccus sp.]|nr:hypothetical protein [Methanomassiliicoccus sp.]